MHTLAILESSARMGGIQHTTLALATGLKRSSWRPVVICPEEGELTRACRAGGIQTQILPVGIMCSTSFWIGNQRKAPNPMAWIWNAGMMLVTARRIAAFLRKTNPDLVLTKGLLCHFYGGLAAKQANVPCLWYVQDLISE